MTSISYTSKLGKRIRFQGQWDGSYSNLFLTDCGKVFKLEDGKVYLSGSFNGFEKHGRSGQWVKLDEPEFFVPGVYMGEAIRH